MTLAFLRHGSEVDAVATERLRGFFAHPEQPEGLFGIELQPQSAMLAAPHIGYAVGLDALRSGEALGAARPYAMRYLLLVDPGAVGSVEVVPVDGGEPLAVSRIGTGEYDGVLLAALREARERLAAVEADVEPRFLLFPALYLAALWLHGPTEQVVPLLPTQAELVDRRVYEAAEIEPILRRLAEAVPEGPTP